MRSGERHSWGMTGAATSIATAIAAALVPKCPLCIAAALSAFGLGAAAAHGVAPWLRPLAFALAASVAVSAAWAAQRRQRARRADAAGCCGGHR